MYLLFILVAIIVILRIPVVRGAIGEWIVSLVIGKTDPEKQFVLHNVIIADDNGKTSQIDHIVINDYGIWSIETKNYSGRIYGKDEQQKWTQVLNYGKVKNHFYNPVKQNHTHMKKIEAKLRKSEEEKLPMHSVVVFVKDNIRYIDSKYVVSIFKLRKTLNGNSEVVLSKPQQEDYFATLSNIKETQISTSEHVANIRSEQNKIRNNICPRCGKLLVLKQGKYGSFYACTGYPNCRFTKKPGYK